MRNISNIELEDTAQEHREALLRLLELKEKLGIQAKNGKITPAKKYRFIIENYYNLPIAQLVKKTKLKASSIKAIAQRFNMSTVYLSENEYPYNQLINVLKGTNCNSYESMLLEKYNLNVYSKNNLKVINLNEFFDWLKEHPKILMINNYKVGSLPIEPDWFIEKANADKRAYEYMYNRRWTESEDSKLKQYVSENKTYSECSKMLKRTGNAIKRRCYDLGIKKPKRTDCKFWSDEEITKLKELWFKGYYPCIIAEEIGRSDRKIISYLERFNYFGKPPEKFV